MCKFNLLEYFDIYIFRFKLQILKMVPEKQLRVMKILQEFVVSSLWQILYFTYTRPYKISHFIRGNNLNVVSEFIRKHCF